MDVTNIFFEEDRKLKYLIFAANLFLVVGLPFVPSPDIGTLFKVPHWLSDVNDGLSLVLAIPMVYQIPSLFRKTGLRVSVTGITENLSTFRENHFPWSEMVKIRMARIWFMKYLLIDVLEPQAYIEKQNTLHRWTMKADLKNFGTPVKIPIHTLQKTPQEILNTIFEVHQKLIAEMAKVHVPEEVLPKTDAVVDPTDSEGNPL